MSLRPCIICCQYVPGEQKASHSTVPTSSLKTFTGSNGSKTLNDILTVYFISKKLLKLPDRKCIRMVEALSVISGNDGIFRMCKACEEIVGKAIECHQKILSLKDEINVLGKRLARVIGESLCSEGSESGNVSSIWLGSENDFHPGFQDVKNLFCSASHPPSLEDDRIKVKVDLNDQAIHLVEVKYDHVDIHDANEDSYDNVDEDSGRIEEVGIDTESGNDNDALEPGSPIQSESNDEDHEEESPSGDEDEDNEEYIPPKKLREVSPKTKSPRTTVEVNRRPFLTFEKYSSVAISRKGTQFPCPFCCNTFYSPHGFRRHLKAHEDSDRLQNKYDCQKCGFPATSNIGFLRHLSIAHGNKKARNSGRGTWVLADETIETETTEYIVNPEWKEENERKAELIPEVDTEIRRKSRRKTKAAMSSLNDDDEVEDEWVPGLHDQEDEDMDHRQSSYENSGEEEDDDDDDDGDFDEKIKSKQRKREAPVKTGEGEKNFECKLCGTRYKVLDCLTKHMRQHRKCEAAGGAFACKLCKFPCLNQQSWLRHNYRVHRNTDGLVCNICQRKFLRYERIRNHLDCHKRYDKFKDSSSGLYLCPLCPEKPGTSMRGFILHKNRQHYTDPVFRDPKNVTTDLPNFLCPQCGLALTSKHLLKLHIRRKHEKPVMRFTCEHCGKAFQNSSHLQSHLIVHEKNRTKDHVCICCGSQYSHKQSLDAHMAKYHPEQLSRPSAAIRSRSRKPGSHKCKHCDEIFPFRYLLVNHMPTAHKDLYTFPCDKCSKAYTSASSLRLHQQVLHGEAGANKSTCEGCGKVFMHRHYVLSHARYCSGRNKTLKNDGTTDQGEAASLDGSEEIKSEVSSHDLAT